MSLFAGLGPDTTDRHQRTMRLCITVKAAPNPSEKAGETVCVAGLEIKPGSTSWVRLYPINFRELPSTEQFRKYDVVELEAQPARSDTRLESWNPKSPTRSVDHLPPWSRRRPLLDPMVEDSMCSIFRRNRDKDPHAPSLALIRPRDVGKLVVTDHPGWSDDEERKIEQYRTQLDLFGGRDMTPLEAPRYQGHYHWQCHETTCKGHKQSLIDWEFTAHQRHLGHLTDSEARAAIQTRWYDEMTAKRELAFYVGNQAKRRHVFHVLGNYYPA
ncbi:hypothetical protein [Kytococcus sp. Marseille-QA3725]